MEVELIGWTAFFSDGIHGLEFSYSDGDADNLAEFAGRACYQSWGRPNPATATNQGYLQNILAQQHFSVLEHASVTFYVTGVSRNLTHELIRHRHLSFSELSQRFVNMADMKPVPPPLYAEQEWGLGASWGNGWDAWLSNYEDAARAASAQGYSRKQAREAARCELPSSMETRIVVTGNHRTWREVLEKRGSLHADAEIRLLALELFKQLRDVAPATYQDFSIKTAKDGREWLKRKKMKPPVVVAPPVTEAQPAERVKGFTGSTKDATPRGSCECGTTT